VWFEADPEEDGQVPGAGERFGCHRLDYGEEVVPTACGGHQEGSDQELEGHEAGDRVSR
jgi:hypothetical protein